MPSSNESRLSSTPRKHPVFRLAAQRMWSAKGVLLLLLLLFVLSASAADEMEIFDLKGRTVEEMIPLLKPFVGEEGTVTGMHNRLVVRTSASRMAEIRRIVEQFDRPPKRLLISVRDSAPAESAGGEIGIAGGNRHIRIGDPRDDGVKIKRYSTRTHDENVRTLQTLEGQPTLITQGVSLPIVTGTGYVTGSGARGRQITYGYSGVDSGFYATATLLGDRVRLEITNRGDRALATGEIKRQESRQIISGKIGEWLPLARVRNSRSSESGAIGRRTEDQSRSVSDLWVKVEVLE